jgi:L-fucose isomerase-like protein
MRSSIKRKLRIGLVGLIQLNYRGNKQEVYSKSVEGLRRLSQELDFEFYWRKDFVVTKNDAVQALKEMEDQKIDFLLIQSTSFSSGYLIQILAQTKAYLGLWAVPEITNSGPLPLNSFCNMNLNMSIIDRFLPYLGKDAKWFYGFVEDDLFKRRFQVTIRALRAIVNVKGSNYALVGGRAPGFDNLFFDPRLLMSKFGVSVDEIEFGDLKKLFFEQSESKVREIEREIREKYFIADKFAEGFIEKMARLVAAVRELAQKGNYDGLAISCWPRFRSELGMVPCGAYAFLSDEGTTTVCEGDIVSLLSMKILEYISNYPAILMDLSSFDMSDNNIFLWHCGIGSTYYSKGQLILERHFNPGPYVEGKGWLEMAPVASMKFSEMPATIARIGNNLSEYFVLTGEFINNESKPDYFGSRGWLGNLKYFGQEINALDLMNTLLVRKVEHHFPVVKGVWDNEFIEVMNWLELSPIKKVQYRDYYQNYKLIE